MAERLRAAELTGTQRVAEAEGVTGTAVNLAASPATAPSAWHGIA